MRNTRLPVSLKLTTWIITERVSMMKSRPTMSETASALAITARHEKPAPRASEPVSPMKMEAG